MIVETLKKSEIFSTLKEKELKKISPFFEKREFTKDEYIFFEGDPSDWLYVASQKRVKIIKHTVAGKNIILEIKSPGEIFCCAAVLDKRPYPESAQVMESASVIRISRKNLERIMEQYPDLKLRFAKYSSDMLRHAHEMLKDIAAEKVEKRIASLLLKLSEKSAVDNAGYKSIDFVLTRQEIAEMLGTTVETCIRTMSKLQKNGIIKSAKKRILVKVAPLKKILENQ